MWRTVRAHPGGAAAIAILGPVVIGSAVYWFAPQRFIFDRNVAESLPMPSVSISASPGGEEAETPIRVEELSSGRFRSLEHDTTGLVRIVALEDGSRFVRLEGLDKSDGPDLRIYLTDLPLSEDWGVWDDGRYVDLGTLKGNIGDSNYRIPDDVDVSGFRTVVIWCRRFTVGFGVAPI
jgi:hypothetical protein